MTACLTLPPDVSLTMLVDVLRDLALLDPEAQWVVTELASRYRQECQRLAQNVTVRGLAGAYCPAVARLTAERLGTTAAAQMLSDEEAARIGGDALFRLDPERRLHGAARIDLAARHVVAAATRRSRARAHCRASDATAYWPFGQEGGFCNPLKLDAAQS